MLLDLITELAQDIGRDFSSAEGRAWYIQQINHAAREMYFTEDIMGCEREQIMTIGSSDQQIALPFYVESILGVRRYEQRVNNQLVDMRPRYSRGGWKKPYLQYPYYQWRLKGSSALERNLTDEAAITISLPAGVTTDVAFYVTITGANEQATRVNETLTFNVGDTTKTTNKFFSEITALQKSKQTSYNLNVTDVGNNLVALIPNNQLRSKYVLVQVLDREEQTGLTQLVEVLYKQVFEPFVSDTDVFTAGEVYEKALYWKTLEQIYAKMDGKEDKAAAAGGKGQMLLSNIISNNADNMEMEIDFGRNPTMQAFDLARRTAFTNSVNDPINQRNYSL